MERLPQLSLFLGVFLLISTSANAHVKSLIVFGDSLFDPGNNRLVPGCRAQANFIPYGSTFFHHPTGRFTNGRTVADFIAQYLKIDFIKPYQQIALLSKVTPLVFPANGINFASAGSGMLARTNKNLGVTSIQAQLRQFEALIDQKVLTKKKIKNSLFLLESGSNDIFNYFQANHQRVSSSNGSPSPKAYANAMLKEVYNFIEKITKHGARKIAFFSVGPLGCIPGRVLISNVSTDRCLDDMTKMVKYYNFGLERLVYTIPRRHPGTLSVFGVVYDNAQMFRANPELYGFVNVEEACCGAGLLNGQLQCGVRGYKLCKNPNEHFYWDYFHPSEHTYKLMSRIFWAGSKRGIRPFNLKTLVNITLKSH